MEFDFQPDNFEPDDIDFQLDFQEDEEPSWYDSLYRAIVNPLQTWTAKKGAELQQPIDEWQPDSTLGSIGKRLLTKPYITFDTPFGELPALDPLSVVGYTLAGGKKGTIGGTGQALSDLSSPANIAGLTPPGRVAKYAPGLGRAYGIARKGIGGVLIPHGLSEIWNAPDIKGQLSGLAETAMGSFMLGDKLPPRVSRGPVTPPNMGTPDIIDVEPVGPRPQIEAPKPQLGPSLAEQIVPPSEPVVPPKPTSIVLKSPTPELVAKLKSEGYVPGGVNEEGYPRMIRGDIYQKAQEPAPIEPEILPPANEPDLPELYRPSDKVVSINAAPNPFPEPWKPTPDQIRRGFTPEGVPLNPDGTVNSDELSRQLADEIGLTTRPVAVKEPLTPQQDEFLNSVLGNEPLTEGQNLPVISQVRPANIGQLIDNIPGSNTDAEFNQNLFQLKYYNQKARTGLSDEELDEWDRLAGVVRNSPSMPPIYLKWWDEIGEENRKRGPKFKPGTLVRLRQPSQATSRPTLAVDNTGPVTIKDVPTINTNAMGGYEDEWYGPRYKEIMAEKGESILTPPIPNPPRTETYDELVTKYKALKRRSGWDTNLTDEDRQVLAALQKQIESHPQYLATQIIDSLGKDDKIPYAAEIELTHPTKGAAGKLGRSGYTLVETKPDGSMIFRRVPETKKETNPDDFIKELPRQKGKTAIGLMSEVGPEILDLNGRDPNFTSHTDEIRKGTFTGKAWHRIGFRYDNGTVLWSGKPTDDQLFKVEDALEEKGYPVKKHFEEFSKTEISRPKPNIMELPRSEMDRGISTEQYALDEILAESNIHRAEARAVQLGVLADSNPDVAPLYAAAVHKVAELDREANPRTNQNPRWVELSGLAESIGMDPNDAPTLDILEDEIAERMATGPIAKMSKNRMNMARIGNKTRMDIGDRKAMIAIFKKTYTGSIAQTAGKELLQNAIDATMDLGPDAHVEIDYDPQYGIIQVRDNGPGLTRRAIDEEYTNLSTSGKRGGSQKTVGELGVGKTTYMITGQSVDVSTVVREADGRLMHYRFEGTPDEIVEGFDVIEDDISNEPDIPTGTSVTFRTEPTKPGETNYDYLALYNYLGNLRRYSNLPVNIKVTRASKILSYQPENEVIDIPARSPMGGRRLEKGETPGTKYEVSVPHDAILQERDVINVILNNRGMFQGVDAIALSEKGKIPDRVTVDLDPLVDATHNDYPLNAPTRERLTSKIRQKVADILENTLVKGAAQERREKLEKIFKQLGNIPGKNFALVDAQGKFTPEEIKQIAQNPILYDIARVMQEVTNHLIQLFPFPLINKKVHSLGFILDDAVRGVNVKNPNNDNEHSLFINPYALLKDSKTPSEAASAILHATIHEFNHMLAWSEGSDFTARLADVYTKFSARQQAVIETKIHELISEWGTGEENADLRYHPKVQELLQSITAIERRPSSGTNVIITESGSKLAASKGQNRTTTSSGSNGAGVPPGQSTVATTGSSGSGGNKPTRTITDRVIGNIEGANNFFRALLSSHDISFQLRQGLGLITRREWWESWPVALKALGSEKFYQELIKNIEQDPSNLFVPQFKNGKLTKSFAEEIGLHMPGLFEKKPGKNREELISSELAEKIPTVKMSNRAYQAAALYMRAQTFKSLMKDAQRGGFNPFKDKTQAKAIADYVNIATGYGSLGRLEQHSRLLGDVFFAPHLISSRLRMLNPGTYIMAPKVVRMQYWRSLFGMLGFGMSIIGLAKYAFGDKVEVSTDPYNADFGKVRIGNTRFDPWGGHQQYFVNAARLLMGKYSSSTTGKSYDLGSRFGRESRWSVTENFVANKTTPLVKFAYDFAKASRSRPVYVGDRITEMFVPMSVQDMIDLMKEDPTLLATSPLVMSGMGSQTYSRRPQSLIFPREYDKKFTGGSIW